MYGILIRKAARMRRSKARTPDPHKLAERVVEDPAHQIAASEVPGALLQAMERCRPAEREVLRPYLLEGRRRSEIAAGETERSRTRCSCCRRASISSRRPRQVRNCSLATSRSV
jgi:hypothetical protein